MRILVAGASGFIGKNFILFSPPETEIVGICYSSQKNFNKFLKDNSLINVHSYKCDLRNNEEVKKLFKKISPNFDVCLFLVGNSDIKLSIANPYLDIYANLFSLINLVKNTYVNKFIFMSTGTVYLGNIGKVSPDKSFANPLVPYGINKLASELYIKFFHKETSHIKEYVILRFFGAYGPMEPQRKIYTNLIKTFCLENKNEYTIYGDGQNCIDAMYIEDTIEGIWKIIKSNKANITIDFAKGEPLTINELILKVANILGKEKIKILHNGETKEPISFFASTKEMKTFFNFKPKTSLENGILKFKDFLGKQ